MTGRRPRANEGKGDQICKVRKLRKGLLFAICLGGPIPSGGQAWDRAVWKTEAFYGNPLVGFAPQP